MFLADFHIHSTFSDGKMSIPELVDFYGSRGFGAIAVTDHLCESESVIGIAARYIGTTLTPATYPMYLEILRTEGARAWDQYKMVLIPGFELSKNAIANDRSAHIVALGAREFIHADPDALDLCRLIRAQGALAIAAHPVATRKIEKQTYHLWNRRFELAREFDAWEVASGPYLFSEVWRSGLPMIASSDLHVAKQINAWKTVLNCERREDAILDAIRRQQVEFKFYGESPHLGSLARHDLDSGVGHLDRPQAV
jgi:predicted metal-dependent phosphoesterase TrpH